MTGKSFAGLDKNFVLISLQPMDGPITRLLLA